MSGSTRQGATGSPLGVLSDMRASGFERLVLCNDSAVDLQAIICIHSTQLGPANGGVRMHPYDGLEEAVADVMRLAEAMTLKWAAAGEDRGGGKAVIVGDPRNKTEASLRRFGQFVDSLGGAYYAGEDAGITLDDMEVIHRETDYVATLPERAGGVGDIAPATARGVVQAMRACAERVWGTPDLAGRRVALQGLGACGSAALSLLMEARARVTVADIQEDRVAAALRSWPGVEAVEPARIFDVHADVFAPFAMGQVIDDETVPRLRARMVCGSANNVLAEPRHGAALAERGITYVPDFIANAGGAIYDADQFRKGGFNAERAWRNVDRIFERVHEVLENAEREGVPAHEAAERIARRRLEALSALSSDRRVTAR